MCHGCVPPLTKTAHSVPVQVDYPYPPPSTAHFGITVVAWEETLDHNNDLPTHF